MDIKYNRANHTAEAVSSQKHKLTHCSEKTSISSALSMPNMAKTLFFSAPSPTTVDPELSTSQLS